MESRYFCRRAFETGPWRKADAGAFAPLWDRLAEAAPRERVERFYMVAGLLLPVWKHLPESASPKIWRALTDDGSAVLGLVLGEAQVGSLRAKLCPMEIVDTASLLTALVSEGGRIALDDGASLAMRRIGAGTRLEIENVPAGKLSLLKSAGCFTEIIAWRTRVFLPFVPDKAGDSLPVLENVLAILPMGAMKEDQAA